MYKMNMGSQISDEAIRSALVKNNFDPEYLRTFTKLIRYMVENDCSLCEAEKYLVQDRNTTYNVFHRNLQSGYSGAEGLPEAVYRVCDELVFHTEEDARIMEVMDDYYQHKSADYRIVFLAIKHGLHAEVRSAKIISNYIINELHAWMPASDTIRTKGIGISYKLGPSYAILYLMLRCEFDGTAELAGYLEMAKTLGIDPKTPAIYIMASFLKHIQGELTAHGAAKNAIAGAAKELRMAECTIKHELDKAMPANMSLSDICRKSMLAQIAEPDTSDPVYQQMVKTGFRFKDPGSKLIYHIIKKMQSDKLPFSDAYAVLLENEFSSISKARISNLIVSAADKALPLYSSHSMWFVRRIATSIVETGSDPYSK